MARTKVNKTAAIKEALAAHSEMTTKELADLLIKQGVKVTTTYVSNIKSMMGASKKKKKGKSGRKPGSSASSNGHAPYADVQSAIVFVKGIGGLDKAKQLIALLESAQGV